MEWQVNSSWKLAITCHSIWPIHNAFFDNFQMANWQPRTVEDEVVNMLHLLWDSWRLHLTQFSHFDNEKIEKLSKIVIKLSLQKVLFRISNSMVQQFKCTFKSLKAQKWYGITEKTTLSWLSLLWRAFSAYYLYRNQLLILILLFVISP